MFLQRINIFYLSNNVGHDNSGYTTTRGRRDERASSDGSGQSSERVAGRTGITIVGAFSPEKHTRHIRIRLARTSQGH
jgi:hypothetical protein